MVGQVRLFHGFGVVVVGALGDFRIATITIVTVAKFILTTHRVNVASIFATHCVGYQFILATHHIRFITTRTVRRFILAAHIVPFHMNSFDTKFVLCEVFAGRLLDTVLDLNRKPQGIVGQQPSLDEPKFFTTSYPLKNQTAAIPAEKIASTNVTLHEQVPLNFINLFHFSPHRAATFGGEMVAIERC